MKKKIEETNAITLIALVITIIVILILAGVSITMLTGENGILNQVQRAKSRTEIASEVEQSEINKGEDIIERYQNGNKGLDTITGKEINNSIVYDKYGNKVVVPSGFKIVNPNDDVTKGIIIEDVNAGDEYTKGSQFVWIPIGNVYLDENNNYKTIIFARYAFDALYSDEEQKVIGNGKAILVQKAENYTDEIESFGGDFPPGSTLFKECLKATKTDNAKAKELEEFIKKTIENKGYYIGRYEAGDYSATDVPREESTSGSNTNNHLTCKSGVYPYTLVTQSDASMLSQTMYKNNNFDSDLINSYAWSTALVFIQTFSGDENYTKQTSLQGTIAKCGEATDGIENDVKCNIYDLAGNVQEFSTETVVNREGYPCAINGGTYYASRYFCANRNYGSSNASLKTIAFRVILYV